MEFEDEFNSGEYHSHEDYVKEVLELEEAEQAACVAIRDFDDLGETVDKDDKKIWSNLEEVSYESPLEEVRYFP